VAPVISYVPGFTGSYEFMAEEVGTGTVEIGFLSVVLANNSEFMLLPLVESVHGTKLRSQVQTFPGVQDIDMASYRHAFRGSSSMGQVIASPAGTGRWKPNSRPSNPDHPSWTKIAIACH
jgi:hypothetical protein